ncbi:zinc-binding dehydrogenase [Nocardioides sp. KIGAM211]|uniref:Zinc-binding dehydrogenase n=1 Tax=Nocardioides luti TaxID=2761101 RepID=A0A7X0RI93_9ACTN|nr:zinc-binding dehydrogenase [Nocardioides luti]MBB6627544.1 zinc-binding dehydrogenase [Nocardioides luti]
MITQGAVVREPSNVRPFAESKPVRVENVIIAELGPKECLVEIAFAGLCHSDLSAVDGSRTRNLPVMIGHEASGVVREVGPETTFRSGDHVVLSWVASCGECRDCRAGRPSQCGAGNSANIKGTLLNGAIKYSDKAGDVIYHRGGVSALSRQVAVHEASLVKIDASIPLDVAAVAGCAVLTGAGAVINSAHPEPGSSIAVFGMGGLGLSAVMAAKMFGCAPVIAVDVLESKFARAAELGATHFVNAAKVDPVAAIGRIVPGGVDFAVESAGVAQVLNQAYYSTNLGGTTVPVGLPESDAVFSVPVTEFVRSQRKLVGSYMGAAVPRRDIPRFLDLHTRGLLPIDRLISQRFSLDEINTAFDHLADGNGARQVIDMSL